MARQQVLQPNVLTLEMFECLPDVAEDDLHPPMKMRRSGYISKVKGMCIQESSAVEDESDAKIRAVFRKYSLYCM